MRVSSWMKLEPCTTASALLESPVTKKWLEDSVHLALTDFKPVNSTLHAVECFGPPNFKGKECNNNCNAGAVYGLLF